MEGSPRGTNGNVGVQGMEEEVAGGVWMAAASPETVGVHGGDDGDLHGPTMVACTPACSEQKEAWGWLDLGH